MDSLKECLENGLGRTLKVIEEYQYPKAEIHSGQSLNFKKRLFAPRLAYQERQGPGNVDTLSPGEQGAPPQRPVSVCCRAEVIIVYMPSTLLACETHVARRREVYCPPSPSALLTRSPGP